MKTEEFLEKWRSLDSEIVRANKDLADQFDLGSAAFDFLFLIGLPLEFQDLNFDYLKEEKILNVNQNWTLDNSDYDKYLSIGFNGSGDPIALNIETQELIYLNHDNYFEEVFINSDMKKFALSVLKINDFQNGLKKLNPNSFFETEFSNEQFHQVLNDLKRIDLKVIDSENSHWKIILDTYLWERDEERKKK